jgi:serine/threonine protein kinase
MGVVYEAFDRELGTRVALKCLPSRSPQAFLRFKREFRALQDLHHENLVRLGELVYTSGQLFFTMELIEGSDIISFCWREERPTYATPSSRRGPGDATLDGDSEQISSRRAIERRREGSAPDADRISSAFGQLVRGLMALHAAQQVHRDVKPSNVLVTHAGRVVLLDFGVATSESNLGPPHGDSRLVGTVEYMAPEQAALGRTGRAADFYSVGAMLFETLTGRLPFEGSAAEVLERKQHERPPRVRDTWASAPEALDTLCERLLDPNAERRPSGEEILEILASRAESETHRRTPTALFVGRQRELEMLERELAEVRPGKASVVHIEGESGTGKTTLVRHFLERALEEPGTLVLNGRCSEREYVPYKALDGVVDDLAEFVASSGSEEIVATLERCLPELVRAFPVLGRVRREWDTGVTSSQADPYVKRLALFRAFREVLASVCAERRVIIALDDMQRADADSLALLSALLRPPAEAPLFLVIASRPYWSGRALVRGWGGEPIELGKLPRHESAALASGLLVASGCETPSADELAERIATEADGHPMFIDELVQQAAQAGGKIGAPVALDAALWSRVERLEPRAQRLVKLAVIAGSPLRLGTLANAAARAKVEDLPALAELQVLRNEHLLRFDGTDAKSRVEPYHDRLAAAVRARLSGSEERDLHSNLAVALESTDDKDPAELAVHWLGAGEAHRAAGYAVTAAEHAEGALAFERAARLYQMALECWPDRPDINVLREKLGDALANAGLGAAAARAYLAAGHQGDELRALDLERRAADQLFRSGHIDEAEPLIQRVLNRMGMSIPRSAFWSLIALLASRARLLFMRLDRIPEPSGPIDARDVALLNACWSVAVGLSMVSNIRGACLQSRNLILAFRVGQPLPLLKALAAEASYVAVTGQNARKRSDGLLRSADELAARIGDPYATGFVTLSKAICSFLMGDWAASRDFARGAQGVFETRPAGAMWELASARTFDLWSSFYLGDVSRMRARIGDFIQEAETRGDRYAATLHRTGLVVMAWLASDEAQLARQEVIEAETGWSRPSFDFQRYLNTLGHSLIDLYEGAPHLAYRRFKELWPGLVRSLYLRIQNLRIEALYMRGASAIGAAAEAPNREALLRDAERCAKRIAREGVGWANALSTMLTAGVAAARGEPAEALVHWRAAAENARAHGMQLFADAADFRAALVEGGAEGAAGLARVREKLAEQSIREPDRICALLAPGVPVSKLRLAERA